MMPSEDYLRAAVAVTKTVIAEHGRVRRTTAECNGCGFRIEGDLNHGSRCPRCAMGTLHNVAVLRGGERPWDASDTERMESA